MSYRARLLLAVLLPFVALAPARAAPVVTVPIDIHENHVYVQARLPHTGPLWFLLDSGAATPVNLIAKSTAARLGLNSAGAQSADAIGGKVQLTFTPPLALTLGALTIPAGRLAIIPLGGGEAQEGHAIDGLLGYAFFQAYNPQIDYPAHRMRLSASPASRAGAVPLRIMSKNAVIDAALILSPGQPPLRITLIIDTGYDGGLLLATPFVQKHDLLKLAGAAATGASLGGSTSRRHLTVASLSIGALSEKNIDAALSTDSEGAFATADADGYIGGDFLKHYTVLFDYRHGRLALDAEPGSH